jgi:hypothetical protein
MKLTEAPGNEVLLTLPSNGRAQTARFYLFKCA